MGNFRFKKVLLIDDNEVDNFINKEILLKSNFAKEIVVKKSVETAIEYLKSIIDQPGDIPDFIFLDIMMSVMDGFVFLDLFDTLPDYIKNHSKIIILSSSDSFADLKRAKSNKYVYRFLQKPLTKVMVADIQ